MNARQAQYEAGRGGQRPGLMYESKTSGEYGYCPNPACGLVVPLEKGAHCDGHEPVALRVEQRPLKWVEESSILTRAMLPNGRTDPGILLKGVTDATVRNSNFGLSSEWLDEVDDDKLGWHLYQWLGALAILERVTHTPKDGDAEAIRKKS